MFQYKEWSELKAKNTKNTISAEVSNRKISFDKSLFPTSITVKDNEILYGPIELKAKFGDIDAEWTAHQVIMHENSPEKAVYTVAQTAENLIVNADITIEFDGFIKVDFRLIPFWSFHKDNVPRLTEMYIHIPLKNEFSSLMHYWPNCESGVCLSSRILNSYSTPDGDTKFGFKPYFWAGWEYGGLGICCESDQGFEIDNPDECIIVSRKAEYTNIRISLLDHTPKAWAGRADEWGNNINPITYSFVFQPTPVKDFDHHNLQNWRAFHLYDVPKFPIFDEVKGKGDTLLERIAASGAEWLILHEDWTVVQNYGLPENEEEFKRFVRDCHKLGLKLMVYFGYEISSLYPGFNDICHEYLNKNVKGNFVGGWQREPMQRDYTVCYHGGYSDVMIKRVEYVMDQYGVDGIYTDGTYVPWECANEAHGCGYRDKDGVLHFEYPIFAVREHVKKLYEAVHSRGGRIDTHQSSCCMMATLAFADSYFDGENIQEFLREDLSNMKMDTFRTEFMGENMGIPCNFISYTTKDFTLRMLAGITLIHNVYPRANNIDDIEFISKLWSIYDDFGTDKAEWHPYFEQQEDISVTGDDVYMSYYKKGNEYLAIVTSFNKELDKAILTVPENAVIVDILDGDEMVVSDKTVEIPLTFGNMKIYCIQQ